MRFFQNLTSDETWKIAESIRSCLIKAKVKASVCVTDRRGRVHVQFNMDEDREFGEVLARLKAKQAALSGQRTQELHERIRKGDALPEDYDIPSASFMGRPGGVPIYDASGKTLLGGAGLHSLSDYSDEKLCIEGVEQAGFASKPTKPFWALKGKNRL